MAAAPNVRAVGGAASLGAAQPPLSAPAPRRRAVRAAGEARSANRARWADADAAAAAAARADPALDFHRGQWPAAAAAVAEGDAERDPKAAAARAAVWAAAAACRPLFDDLDRLASANLARVQAALAAQRLGPHHFAGSTGYGRGDLGRAALDAAWAQVFGAEAAAVRAQFLSGTHAIAAGLFGALRPGDELLAVAGPPYDTLEEVVGARGAPGAGSLAEWGVSYRVLPLLPSGGVDLEGLKAAITPATRVALVQRSCGYALRPTLSLGDIAAVVKAVRAASGGRCLVLVDNCYGEFTDTCEPTHPSIGADLAMGSLIKNPGGTLAPSGGYVAGRRPLVAAALARLAAPGVGADAGCVSGEALRLYFQGLWAAPTAVAEALKGGRLVAAALAAEGYAALPPPGPAAPHSFITAVALGSPARMAAFCAAVQAASPVGAHVRPEPGATPGYGDEVIFADGTFVDGSTSELSADGPLRAPHAVYCQGGSHWTQWALALERALPALRAAAATEAAAEAAAR
jgi:cystathionine beta-lyase family protein involved in aluminum resistance